MLDRLQDFVTESNNSNSNTDKINVISSIKDDVELIRILRYVYSPFKQYYVTSKNCKKRSDLVATLNNYGDNIFGLLDDLNERVITGHDALGAVNVFVNEHHQHEELIWNIIDRNLKTRSTSSMINKVIPNAIPTFDVALANTYDEKTKKKVDFSKDNWFLSRKLDGVRCLAFFDEVGEVTFTSRSGKPFETLGNLKEELEDLNIRSSIMDGEICMMDDGGNEDFQSIIKEIKRKDHTIENPMYKIFDFISLDDFENKISDNILSERQDILGLVLDQRDGTYYEMLEQHLITGVDMVEEKMNLAIKAGWEGLMLRKDDVYRGKRSNDILKVKKFYDAEYTVIELENGIHRVIVDGKEVEEIMLSNVVIEHKGNRVQVGSGFSHEERRNYFQNPSKILNKMITVSYFEETTNQSGEYSLRFPVIKAVYENKRTF
jgi:DNA ligase-1